MNKLILGLGTFLLSVTSLHAQHVFNANNAREGEQLEYCHQHVKEAQDKISNPAEYAVFEQAQAQLMANYRSGNVAKSGQVYIIPVVFHVLHAGGPENISYEQIEDCIRIMNRDYRRLNQDADNVVAAFQGLPADVEIEFRLATKAPNGACFSGVTRTQSILTFHGDNGGAQLEAAFSGNDVYNGNWPHSKYLNVLVASDIGGAAGYTRKPGFTSTNMNSIWVQATYVGSIGTGDVNRSRTMTHEVGHWLNLSHTWGNTNDPGLASNCNTDDGIADTPNTKGVTSCNLNENSCGPLANVENYMDYSYCSKMFTPGQVSMMRTALESSVSNRNNLWTTQNLFDTGAGDVVAFCKAQFDADVRVVCVGQSVNFSDNSVGTITSRNWSFQGGTPATATAENVEITYNTPGLYEVALTATDGVTSNTNTRAQFIRVLPAAQTLPFYEGFENISNIAQASDRWIVSDNGNNNKFDVTTAAGHAGSSKSLRLLNFNQLANNIDVIESANIDLSQESVDNLTFSFRYAYRSKPSPAGSNIYETLRVFFSKSCGDSWDMRRSLSSSVMGGTSTQTNNYTPAAADWKTVHMAFNSNAVHTQYFVNTFRFKFEFTSDGGNNLYLDDINLYRGTASDNPVLGIQEDVMFTDFVAYPNPTDGDFHIGFTLDNAQDMKLVVTDITGKVISTNDIHAATGSNEILLDGNTYAPGVYLVQLNANGIKKVVQFIKK